MNERDVLGIIVCNMHDELISELTAQRTLGSVPFGGRYRFIDFALSNMVNSGIRDVAVVPSIRYQSLLNHLGSGREWDLARKIGGLSILPPYGRSSSAGVYHGRMEALANIQDYIKANTAETVVLSDSDVIANIDFRPAVAEHLGSGADITLLYKKAEVTPDMHAYNPLFFDEKGRLADIYLSPELSGEQNVYLDIAVIRKPLLDELVQESVQRGEHSFLRSVLMAKKDVLNIRGFFCPGWGDKVNSLTDFYHANLALLRPEVRASLFPKDRPIYTKVRDEVSARYGLASEVADSLVTDGCIVEGSVSGSVLFRGVHIGEGAVVRGCVLMHNTRVLPGAVIENVITDKNVVITEGKTLSGAETMPLYIPKGTVI